METADSVGEQVCDKGPGPPSLRMTNYGALCFLIEKGPGRTEVELAAAIFGDNGYQARVSFDCRLLALRGVVRRVGSGGAVNPFRYYPVTPITSD